MHEGFAIRAHATEVAGSGCQREVIDHVERRSLRHPTSKAVELTRPARPPRRLLSVLEEFGRGASENEGRAVGIDGGEPAFDPSSNRVLVRPEEPRQFFHGVASMDFDPLRIRATLRHASARFRGQLCAKLGCPVVESPGTRPFL